MAIGRAMGDRVEVNGMQMYYEVSGQGDPVIVLHGSYMNIPSMGAIIPKLAETHKVYALELQGHGRTTDIDRPITYANLADDVEVSWTRWASRRPTCSAYSMGAVAGLQLAIRHPGCRERNHAIRRADVGPARQYLTQLRTSPRGHAPLGAQRTTSL